MNKLVKRLGITLAVIVCLVLGVWLWAYQTANSTADGIFMQEVDFSKVKDGTYQGFASTELVEAKVEITMSDGVMTGIELLEHKTGLGYEAYQVVGWIQDNQTINVDSVSGATLSSAVIKKATEQALLEGTK